MLRRQEKYWLRKRSFKTLDNFSYFIVSLIISLFILKLYNFDPYNKFTQTLDQYKIAYKNIRMVIYL